MASSVTSKKSPNVYKKWPKTDFTRKWKNDTSLTNCLKWGNFGKIIVTTGLEKLPKVQLIVQSGHIDGKREREKLEHKSKEL